MEDYEVVIGLEVHAQLQTKSKMFCRCNAGYANAEPNTLVCPVCLGMPGVLPSINEMAVRYTVMTALALNCSIPEHTKFDRKNYLYPDLMKGYQISQYDAPMSKDGWVYVDQDGDRKRVRINRVHLEEDTARLLHRSNSWGETYSLIDVNRSGVPLMEIVSEPDIRSAEEARQYLIKLRSILRYLGVSTGNMEEGSFRCDANVSLRPRRQEAYGAKVEVKNMNSFRAVFRALEYEVQRQAEALRGGDRIHQETRGWVEERGVTVSQRSKEYAHDYRYFPEPDLPPMFTSPVLVEEIRAALPELPDTKRDRFVSEFGLSPYDANLLVADKDGARFFEEAQVLGKGKVSPKLIANWVLGELARMLNATGSEIADSKMSADRLIELLELVENGVISGKIAKSVFEEMFEGGRGAADLVASRGLTQISDRKQILETVRKVLEANAQAAADYRAGKRQSLAFLVGQVMKETRGRANPELVNDLFRDELGEGG
ncbi:MAG: Asp-tRNA(Asn)/Glu-tRNA(Gln) amidotransferase subunit GatB [Dehalococcoidia bacterium]|nr:Asp-tRNA(Asn)/Glu-tRNA(Gln) amidotransferase subunit GatB [Dehalococcoidia bacterium]